MDGEKAVEVEEDWGDGLEQLLVRCVPVSGHWSLVRLEMSL